MGIPSSIRILDSTGYPQDSANAKRSAISYRLLAKPLRSLVIQTVPNCFGFKTNREALEQGTLPSSRCDLEIVVRQLSGDAASRRPVQKTSLHQEGFVDLFDGVRF